MSAASISALIPRYHEGRQYWSELAGQCERHVDCVNATLLRNQVEPTGLLEYAAMPDSLRVSRPRHPEFRVDLTLRMEDWGPVINARFCHEDGAGKLCLPHEFELPIAIDGDKQVVAIYDEGRSFSPREVTSYIIQYFRSCYPNISFPC